MSRNRIYIPRYLSEMTSEDFGWFDNEDPSFSPFEGSEISSHEDSEVKCNCGLLARLRVSHTPKNPYRLFYNCPKNYDSVSASFLSLNMKLYSSACLLCPNHTPSYQCQQCEFFRWCDEPALTGDRHVDELNLIRNECTRLQGRLEEMEQQHNDDRSALERERSELISGRLEEMERQHNNDRSAWEREKYELIIELSTVQNELDEIKRRIKSANESNLMPPLDKLSIAEDDGDDEIVKYTI